MQSILQFRGGPLEQVCECFVFLQHYHETLHCVVHQKAVAMSKAPQGRECADAIARGGQRRATL